MGWFDEQIRQRKQSDNDLFEEAFIRVGSAVMGSNLSSVLAEDREIALNAIGEIARFYHVKLREIPEDIQDINEQIDYLMRPYSVMRREVHLEKGWYKDAIGGMLGVRRDTGKVVALIPAGLSGYFYYDHEKGSRVKINHKNEDLFEKEAIAFYKPFPLKKMNVMSLCRYILQTLSLSDVIFFAVLTLLVTLVGMLTTKINNIIFSDVIESQSMQLLAAVTVFLICVSVGTLLFQSAKGLIQHRINTKMSLSVEAAAMMRVLSLPPDFFKQYSAGELSSRTQYISQLSNMLVSVVLSAGLTSVFSLMYISQIFVYAPALVVPSLVITLVTLLLSVITTLLQMRISKRSMELASKENGMKYAMITGIQKIKLAGAEKRMFGRWAKLYAKTVELTYNPPLFLKINPVITTAISLFGTIVLYYMAIASKVSVADYYAFNSAYGMVSGAFSSLVGIALTVAQIKPILDMVKPILEAVPEISEDKEVVTRIMGGIEMNNVSFRYHENMPLVLDDISLKIRPGQYVAIVGSTGCGKSTLMRLLLGFETPQKGAIYYDGKDLASLDLKSLRRKIGVVMQNGKLFSGDIFSNIVISAPWLTLDKAWEAAELAGIAEDIRRMPMGMHTIISEGSGGISGGQRQRLMIARAIAPKPRILMFDEATSALDNLTQKKVSESLDSLKCTRIVIAHRLSTIQQCDRILYLEKGKILEEGTYEELIAKGGRFAGLVEHQRL